MKYIFIIFLFVTIFTVHEGSVLASSMSIPFEAEDVGLQEYLGDDTSAGARSDGTVQINNAILTIVNWIKNILGLLAAAWIIWNGFLLVNAQGNESVYETSQRSIMWGVIALVGSFLVDPFIRNVIYGGGDVLAPGQALLNPEMSTGRGILEIEGLIFWGKSMIAIIAVVMILYTGMKTMVSLDSDDQLSKQKTNMKWIVGGIILIIFNEIMVGSGIYGNPSINASTGKPETLRDSVRVITEASGFVGFLLYFVATMAVAALVYGGYLILTAAFNEEQADTGKTIIKNVLIGLVIVFISYTLVQSVIFLKA
jgi:hypothetical protein